MAKFSGEAGFSGIYFAVYDDSYTKSPTKVDKDDVFFSFYASLQVFSIGHRPGVVIYADLISYFLGEDFG